MNTSLDMALYILWTPYVNAVWRLKTMNIFFLRCLNFENARRSLYIDICSINSYHKNLPSHLKIELLLFGDPKLSAIDNNLIVKASIKYILTTNRFSVPLFWYCFLSFFSFKYIYPIFPSASTSHLPPHPPTFFIVLFEAAVRYVLVLYFLVSFLVISL